MAGFKDGSKPGSCTVCGNKSWSPNSNKCEEHRRKTKAGRIGGNVAASPAKETAARTLIGNLPTVDAKTFSGKPPTAAEWEDKLTSFLVLATMTYVSFAIVRPLHVPDEVGTQWTNHLAMTDAEATTIVEPLAHYLAGSSINKKHGREAIEVLAFAPAALSFMDWMGRVNDFKAEIKKLQQGAPNPAANPAMSTDVGVHVPAPENGETSVNRPSAPVEEDATREEYRPPIVNGATVEW